MVTEIIDNIPQGQMEIQLLRGVEVLSCSRELESKRFAGVPPISAGRRCEEKAVTKNGQPPPCLKSLLCTMYFWGRCLPISTEGLLMSL